MIVTVGLLAGAIALLAWGLYRNLPYGKLGIVAWLQTLVLMLPWLVVFGSLSFGIAINFAAVLFGLVFSIVAYIALGRWLRSLAVTAELPLATSGRSELEQATPEQTTAAPPTEKPSLPPEDLQAIQSIFSVDTYFATDYLPYKGGVICPGNLRGEAKAVHQQLTERLQAALPDRYRLFMVPNSEGKPMVVILPMTTEPIRSGKLQKLAAVFLAVATLGTCLETSAILQGFSLVGNPTAGLFQRSLPFALGLFGIAAVREVGHWLMAKRYQARLGPPIFLPAWQLGTFGAMTRLESFLANRSQLFDIGAAGAIAAGSVALLLLGTGFILSPTPQGLEVPTIFFQGSILVGTIAKLFLGQQLQSEVVRVHPLVILGWLGLIMTALNLMPAGQLDGGRMIQAIYGTKTAKRLTIITLVVLGLVAIVNPLALYWALVILLLQRDVDQPSLDEITEPDDIRAGLGLLLLFLMAATLIPMAPGLAGRLGIGG
ncbi:site-2 protease family protein [Thermosynechococcus vestitus]|uniref:Tll1190 protein n=1 Tax=Thermosynechococcus vestitus (strain NIES-2133 / IAM M-273 / BP-1) TaxID=197221 RepID=Q8DJN2_THEVB|nr:site-2 protease family protein [Thermosynechococcus vestitus]BAC08742.1 tll1190 [Thermosynechococcus vestitus BP-1]